MGWAEVAESTVPADNVLDFISMLDLFVVSEYRVGTVEIKEVASVGYSQFQTVAANKCKIVVALHMPFNRHDATFRAFHMKVLQGFTSFRNTAERLAKEAYELGEVGIDYNGFGDGSVTCSTQLVDEVAEVVKVCLLFVH